MTPMGVKWVVVKVHWTMYLGMSHTIQAKIASFDIINQLSIACYSRFILIFQVSSLKGNARYDQVHAS